MMQGNDTTGGGSGRGPFYIMLGIIGVLLVAAVGSAVWHLVAVDGDSRDQDGAGIDASQLQQSKPAQIGQAPRVARPVKKEKTRAQLLTLAGKGKKGRRLSAIGGPYSLETPAAQAVADDLRAVEKRHKVGFVMLDVKTGTGLVYNPDARFYCASAIKGPYVIALNKWERASVTGDVRELMKEAVEVSDNEAYETLHGRFGTGMTEKMMRYSNATSFTPEYSYGYGSARDFVRFWVSGYWYFFKDTNRNSRWCRGLFDSVNESFIHQALKSECTTYSKAGWFPGDEFGNVHNDAGIVMAKVGGESRPYVLAVMSTACGDERQLRGLVRSIDAVHEDMVSE